MKKLCDIKGTVCTNSCMFSMNGKEYTVIGQYTRHGADQAKVIYYLIGEDTPDLAVRCGSATAAVHYLDNCFADFWFWADVQKYGGLMVERYENKIMKIRKVG